MRVDIVTSIIVMCGAALRMIGRHWPRPLHFCSSEEKVFPEKREKMEK